MNPLISTLELYSLINDSNLVILDATLAPVGTSAAGNLSVQDRYLETHLPGAIYFDIENISDPNSSLPHMLPSAEKFAHDMSILGINEQSKIVIYEQDKVFSAPRAWWTFRAFGINNVQILDGGLKAWLKANYPIENGTVATTPSVLEVPTLCDWNIKDFSQIQSILASSGQILDARSEARFNGTASEPRPGIQSGHMPGSINVPFTELFVDNYMKSPEQLFQIFAAKGVDLNKPITTSCGSGVTAAVIAFALELVGAKSVSLYDGSWAEYASNPKAIIETIK